MKIIKSYDFNIGVNFLQENFSSPTHWPDWNLVVSKHFHTDFFYFYAVENDMVVGICPAHKVRKNKLLYHIYSGQFHFIPFGGWLFSKKIDIGKINLPLKWNETYISCGLPAIPDFGFRENDNNDNNDIFSYDTTLLLDLRLGFEKIWSDQIDSKRRNMIRKAKKSSVLIKIEDTFSEEFYSLYRENSSFHNLDVLPFSFFQDLKLSSEHINYKILTAIIDDKVLANMVLVYDKNYSIYWLGNNAIKRQNLGQGDLLQYEAINLMIDAGCRYYDLCHVNKEKLPNIYEFKRGFAKNEIRLPFELQKTIYYKIINKIMKCL